MFNDEHSFSSTKGANVLVDKATLTEATEKGTPHRHSSETPIIA